MTETLSTDLPANLEASIHRVLDTACEKEIRLATAESCTGGLLASLLTDVQGSSHVFDRGYVVYTDKAKTELLHVPADLIERHGAVSMPAAVSMAEGALARSGADIVASVTGFAGPAGDKEEGLVYLACARRGRETRTRECHFGARGRGAIRMKCVETAIEMIEEMLE